MIPDVFLVVSNCNTLGIRLFPTTKCELEMHPQCPPTSPAYTQGAINKTVSVKLTFYHDREVSQ